MKNIFRNAPVGSIRAEDCFFAPRIRTNHTATIPANIDKCRESGRIDAFTMTWKKGEKDYTPHVFWDSDFAKVIEGLAYSQILFPDPEREKMLNDFADLIVSAQQKDGYLNTYFTLVEPDKRWSCVTFQHELYCAGHLMEAAVAHFRATGRRNFLDAMCRYADYIATVFGTEEGKLHGYPGHEEIELALCKLAEASGNSKYQRLAEYFINERGKEPNFFREEEKRTPGFAEMKPFNVNPAYFQADKPVREQTDAKGHAVRAVYLYSGMADIAERTNDPSLLAACERLWKSITEKRMYITGGIGSRGMFEEFGNDYELPDDTAYAESCASIGLVLFAERMANITGEGKYADVMEKCLYNGAMSGLSLDGIHFFYANPIEVTESKTAQGVNLPERSEWFGCSCCPTNYCRFVPQIPSFAYAVKEDELRIHIPVAAEGRAELAGNKIAFRLASGYPYDGKIRFELTEGTGDFTLSFRIPSWCGKHAFRINGKAAEISCGKGYAKITRSWNAGDTVELELEMKVRTVRANSLLASHSGKFVLQYGPMLYTLEGIDNGSTLNGIIVPLPQDFEVVPAPAGFPEGTKAIRGKAFREGASTTQDLYTEEFPPKTEMEFLAVPYALWQNRGKTLMQLFLRYQN